MYRKLLSLAYGVCDSGRKLLKTSDVWMINEVGMKRLVGAHQVFVMRGKGGGRDLMVLMTTDDFLSAGTKESVGIFFGQIERRFTVVKSIIEERMKFNGFMINNGTDGAVTLDMQ